MLPSAYDKRSLQYLHAHWIEDGTSADATGSPKAAAHKAHQLVLQQRSMHWVPTITNVILATTMLPLCVMLVMVLAHASARDPAAGGAVKARKDVFEDIWQHHSTHSTFIRQLASGQQSASLERQKCLLEHSGKLPKVLLISVFKDDASFGVSPSTNGTEERKRTLADHLSLLSTLDYPPCLLSLALLVSDRGYFEAEVTQLAPDVAAAKGFGRITITHREADTGMSGTADRHDDHKQMERRRMLARARNFAVTSALQDEGAVLWTDCDMVQYPSSMLRDMVAAKKDIITPICNFYTSADGSSDAFYDRNSWAGPRIKPSEEQWTMHKNGSKVFVPAHGEGIKFPIDMANSTEPFVELDSVGATVLLVNANVHREGALFSVTPVVGAEWGHEGYDGLESEGLCFLAKALGYKCWAMTKVVVHHSRS